MGKIIKSSYVINKKTKQILMNIPRKQVSQKMMDKAEVKKKAIWRLEDFE